MPSIVIKKNNPLTMLHTMEETHNIIFKLKNESALGPHGFGPYFFQTYWHIIKEGVHQETL